MWLLVCEIRVVSRPVLAFLSVLCVLFAAGCDSSNGDDGYSVSRATVDEGSWYVREAWPHDGNPVESANFVVYSDSASLEARREVAAIAEEAWAEFLDELAIDTSELHYPEGRNKIDIYAYHDHSPQDWSGKAYYGGLLVWSPDHEGRQGAGSRLAPVLKHELVHVLQWLITEGENRPTDVWFVEGLPIVLAGDITPIRGLDQLNRLNAEFGTINPISVKSYSQITNPEIGENYLYPLFRLAVEYLIDGEGQDRSLWDMRDLMIDVADGSSFDQAFQRNTGIRLEVYESRFFSLMDEYLPQYRNAMFAPAPFAALSIGVVILVVSSLVFGYRKSRMPAGSEDLTESRPGPLVRFGFYSEMGISVVVVLAFFLGFMFAVGTEDALYNEAYVSYRSLAYGILVSYLLVSTAVLVWAVYRWASRSRSALLVVPLIISVTGIVLLILTRAVTLT